tara:strand:+ start:319 stop:786 length:468 start_codon:yes stop_codon:yes gene_type:complete
MNKPTPFGKQTFAEYEKEVKEYKAFNLKAEKVELGAVQDIQSMLADGERGISEANRIGGNIQSLVNDVNAAVESIDGMEYQLTQVSNPINMLGAAIQDFEFIKGKLQQQVKDLGISIKDIEGYSEAEKQYKVWIKEKKWLEGREDAGKTALKRIK